MQGFGFDPGCGRGQGSAARQQLPRFPCARSRGAALHAHESLPERNLASASNGNVKPSKLLVIKGLPASIDEEYLKAIFKTYGTVTWTRMTAGVIGKKIYRCFSLFYFILLRFVTWTLMTAAPGDNRTSSGFVLFASEQVQILKRAVV